MKILVYFSLAIYFTFYLFEGPVRYVLNMFGADTLIFIRDIILAVPLLLIIFLKQFINHNIHPAFIVFALVIAVHGAISILNIGDPFIIGYCTKLLVTLLAGAVLAPYLMQPNQRVLKVVFVFWGITFIAVLLDKYFIAYPWQGMGTTIGDVQVEISRDWQISGEEKRAAGLMRSSINAAIIEPLLAFILIFNTPKYWRRLAIMALTTVMLYWTTQKSSILAFSFTCGLLVIAYKRPVPLLKVGISAAFIMMIALPVILPQFNMPHERGVFSMGSFYMRVEEIWPKAWLWIERHDVFPFGVGLGGIGGAMRFYAPRSVNYADNMYIFIYAYFGLLGFVYMGWVWWKTMLVSGKAGPDMVMALSMISFLVFYGGAMTMIEDQMASLFLGAAVTWVATNHAKRNRYAIE